MSDQAKNSRSLSEISHLFLSSVRGRQTSGSPRPQRKAPPPVPPAEPSASVDLTPEEFQHVYDGAAAVAEQTAVPPVKTVLASHLPQPHDAAIRYARSLAASGQRVGLIAVDASVFHLMTFEASGSAADIQQVSPTSCFDARAMRDAISELNCDLDCWVLSVANPRLAEARSLLHGATHWVLLTTADHDGVVAAYRMLKGVADLGRPRLSLAVVDPEQPAEAEQIFHKLSGVCLQFLGWPVEREPAVGEAPQVSECHVMQCQATHDKAQLATASHWRVVEELLQQSRDHVAQSSVPVSSQAAAPAADPSTTHHAPAPATPRIAEPAAIPLPPRIEPSHCEEHTGPRIAEMPMMPRAAAAPVLPEVIELSEDASDPASILGAVMKHSMSEIVECPLHPPMCPEAHLAVSRDRRIVLIALAGHGLAELRNIGQAYRWLVENRALLAMALPQFSLDPHQHPHLRLIVDQADLAADVLQPLFEMQTVSIHTYRRIRWGQRTGLLLDAA